MSNVNIRRLVDNIRSGTNVYTPIVEAIVNGIQAIDARAEGKGIIKIIVHRSDQNEMDDTLPSPESFTIQDNGIGFNAENRDHFDTLYTDHKIQQGGKGFGRFTWLKYFEELLIESVFEDKDEQFHRKFKMGTQTEIIVSEEVQACTKRELGSRIFMCKIKGRGFPDKKIGTIARTLIERLLPYFIDEDYDCPQIIISEEDGSGKIVLNEFIRNQLSNLIEEIPLQIASFKFGDGEKEKVFQVRIFKFYSPRNQKSKISLVADRREVTDTTIHTYVPEFIDEFYDKRSEDGVERDRNYIVKAYVFSPYLDANVSLERGGFDFPEGADLISPVGQAEIEKIAAQITRDALGETITARQERKQEQVREYVQKSAPWHGTISEEIDLSAMPYNPTPMQIETIFQTAKFQQEISIRQKVEQLLADEDASSLEDNLANIVNQISKTSRNDLVHYIAMRRQVLTLFGRSFELTAEGKYPSEATVHDIVFPRRGNTAVTALEEHNLWIIDERLNFTNFISSDKPLDGGNSERPDVLVFDTPVMFRGDNDASNPITIFEFKKPGRDDFADQSSKEDPVEQILRYVNNIKKGKYKTPKGRAIHVAENTPFYGYVMCETTEKVKEWLHSVKEFTPMPDGQGWFRWFGNNKLYMEVLSWDKVLRDAEMRNSIFFHKLGIE